MNRPTQHRRSEDGRRRGNRAAWLLLKQCHPHEMHSFDHPQLFFPCWNKCMTRRLVVLCMERLVLKSLAPLPHNLVIWLQPGQVLGSSECRHHHKCRLCIGDLNRYGVGILRQFAGQFYQLLEAIREVQMRCCRRLELQNTDIRVLTSEVLEKHHPSKSADLHHSVPQDAVFMLQ
jgi:hypothetical protein